MYILKAEKTSLLLHKYRCMFGLEVVQENYWLTVGIGMILTVTRIFENGDLKNYQNEWTIKRKRGNVQPHKFAHHQ